MKDPLIKSVYYTDPEEGSTAQPGTYDNKTSISVSQKGGNPLYRKSITSSIHYQMSPSMEEEFKKLHSSVLGRKGNPSTEWFFQELILQILIREERFSKVRNTHISMVSCQKHVFGRILGILHPKTHTVSLTAVQVENTKASIQQMVDYLLTFSDHNHLSLRTNTRDFQEILESLKSGPEKKEEKKEPIPPGKKYERFDDKNFSSINGTIFFTKSDYELIEVINSSIHAVSTPTNYLGSENKQRWWYFEGKYHGRFQCRKTKIIMRKEKVLSQIYGIEHEENHITLTSIRIPSDYQSLKALEADIQMLLNHPVYIIINHEEVEEFLTSIRTERNKISRP